MLDFHTYTLPSGLRVIMAKGPTQVVYCGLAVDAGTRDERPTESGMAHFTEHMSFKGTERRRSWHITQRMEAVGGDLNAFTGKEETVYYCNCLREHVGRAIDVLFDVVFHSTYPQAEMDKEVEVVVAEIESYNDSPAELIYDEFEARLFQGHPLGRNILGDAERLRQFTTADMQRFVRRTYRPDRMVLFVYGNVDEQKVLKAVPALPCREETSLTPTPSPVGRGARIASADSLRFSFNSLRRPPLPTGEGLGERFERLDHGYHQAHVMLGNRAYGADDDRYLSLFLLNNILGGPAMGSRLNQLLREKNGLVYTVESTLTAYTDTGVWAVYFGCAPEDVRRCLRLVKGALHRLVERPLTEHQLAAAKRQLKGQVGISHDNFESVAIGMGKRFLHYNRTQTPEQLFAQIDRLTTTDLWQVAQDIFNPNHLVTLTLT